MQQYILFIIIAIVAIVFVLLVTYKASASRCFFLGFPLLFLVYFLIFIVLGVILINYETKEYLSILGVTLSLLGYGLGIWLTKTVMAFKPDRELKYFVSLPYASKDEASRGFLLILFGFALTLSFIILFYYISNTVPLWDAITSLLTVNIQYAFVKIKQERLFTTYYQLISGEYYGMGYINQFRIIVLPMISYYCLGTWWVTRRRKWQVLAYTVFVCCWVGLWATTERGRLGMFLVGLLVLFAYYRPQALTFKLLFKIGIGLFVLYFVSTIIQGRTDLTGNFAADSSRVLNAMKDRITYGNAINTYLIIDLYSQKPRLEGGKVTFGYLLDMLPKAKPRKGFSAEMMDELYHLKTGSASASFPAEAYADFGLIGCLLAGIFLGFAAEWIFVSFIRRSNRAGKKTPSSGAYFAVLAVALLYPAIGAVFSPLAYGLISGTFLYLLINFGLKFTKKDYASDGTSNRRIMDRKEAALGNMHSRLRP